MTVITIQLIDLLPSYYCHFQTYRSQYWTVQIAICCLLSGWYAYFCLNYLLELEGSESSTTPRSVVLQTIFGDIKWDVFICSVLYTWANMCVLYPVLSRAGVAIRVRLIRGSTSNYPARMLQWASISVSSCPHQQVRLLISVTTPPGV